MKKTFWFMFLSVILHGHIGQTFAHEDCSPIGIECASCKGLFTLSIDWLHWKSTQDNLAPGTFVDDFPDPVLKIVNASSVEPNFKYSSGFRTNLGYQLPCNSWEFNLNYTYLPINSRAAFVQTAGSETNPQFIAIDINAFPSLSPFGQEGFVLFSSILTKWRGHLSYLDADLSRTLTFYDCFSLRPYLGFRGAWMKQTFIVEGDFPSTPIVNNASFVRLNNSEQFHGYGVNGGFWVEGYIGAGFSVLGNVGGSILASNFTILQDVDASLQSGQEPVFVINGKSKKHTVTPTLNYSLGLEYSLDFAENFIAVRAAWEQNVFFNLNHFSTYGGNFSTQGLNLSLQARF